MKKIFVSVLCAALLLTSGQASAHVLKTDGTIGAVMHIDPDDNPIAGQPSNFYFDIKDTQSRFKGSDCNCQLSISLNSKLLETQPLFQQASSNSAPADNSEALATYTFPTLGVYDVTLTGSPNDGSSFKAFSLNYEVRVDRGSSSATTQSKNTAKGSFDWVLVAAFGAIVAGFVALFVWSNRRAVKDSKPHKSKKDTADKPDLY
jgi:hypothetical protein